MRAWSQIWTKNELLQMYISRVLTIFPEELHFRRSALSNSQFCTTPLSSCFCISCCLWVRNSKLSSFFQYFRFSTSYNIKWIIPWRLNMRLVMFRCTDMWISVFSLPLHHIWINPIRPLFSTSITWQTRNYIFVF